MRIIAGKARGTVLETLDGEDTRPTLGRVKENFFNAINFDVIDAKILDLFAGSGQLGFEALSRGAREAVFVDSNADCIEIIRKNAQKAKLYDKCNIYRYDYSEYLGGLKKRRDFDKFDIVFIDPPYESSRRLINDCVKKLIKHEFISDGGLVICETGNGEQLNLDLDEEIISRIQSSKIYKYGKIYITILKIKLIETDSREDEKDG
ncbi:MAG: 16S rRNA (guanine(966)-N(2))-methyltransferase RsmD [Oscillospiraceae bacterium]|nr:16S rRNA (guanine(966)-N(2))-methyltransferase RsmD [Oscillospiraceae bacterium]